MKKRFKIQWIWLFIMIVRISSAQTDQGLLPFSNPVLLNPSFAGYDKNTSIWSTLQFHSQPQQRLNNAFTLTYDSWSEKLKGGTGFFLHSGVIGELNTGLTGAGFVYARPLNKGKHGQFTPSFAINAFSATKQWFVQIIDGIFVREMQFSSPPGIEFFRYNLFRPGGGLLWNDDATTIGITGSYGFQFMQSEKTKTPGDTSPYQLIFHISHNRWGTRKGLMSQPVNSGPELILLFTENLFLTRTGYRIEQKRALWGLYLQNNFKENVHGIGAAGGWKFQNIRINLTAGAAYIIPQQKTAFFGEAGIGLIIEHLLFDNNNPWFLPKRPY